MNIFVSVPIDPRRAECATVEKLDKSHAAFEQTTGEQTVPSESRRDWRLQAVECFGRRRFTFETDDFRDADLHSRSQFIRPDAGSQRRICGIGIEEVPVP